MAPRRSRFSFSMPKVMHKVPSLPRLGLLRWGKPKPSRLPTTSRSTGVETTTAAHTEALQPSPEAIAIDDEALVGTNVATPDAEAVATPRRIATEAIATDDDDVDDHVLDDLWLADRMAPAMAPTPHTPRFGQREAEVAGAIFGPVPQQLDGQLDRTLSPDALSPENLLYI